MDLTPLEIMLIITNILEFNPLLQAVKVIRTGKTEGIALGTYGIISIIGCMWLIYGFQIGSWPLIIGNTIKLFTALSVLVVTIRYRFK